MTIQFQYDQKSVTPDLGKMTFYDECYVDAKSEDIPMGQRIRITIHPKTDIVLRNLEINLQQNYQSSDRIFCNGFQSWSESKEHDINGQIPNLKWPTKSKWQFQGDYQNNNIIRGQGQLHSWTYTYIRGEKSLFFLGSLNEHTSFTIFQHDCNNGSLKIKLDVDELKMSHSYPAIDLVILKGEELAVFDTYFKQMEIPTVTAPPMTGWTSWYNYYTDISESIILKNLEAFAEKRAPIDLFQIDDGYQQAVGDWLKIKPEFPKGMGAVAQQIHQKGYKAGLWLAPFICAEHSDIYKNKKQWILKDKNGQEIKAGYSKAWGGWYYALDFYQKEVKDYLTALFFTIFNKWGFDLIKLDFLYAVCLAPPDNKTRGQVMCEAMDFLRQLANNKLLLGCGVPLGAAFGRVDYCRIGSDVHLSWEDKWLKWSQLRERTSTYASLKSTLGRWQLNGRAFHNDPDVFILRDDNNKLTSDQQSTLLLVNRLLGHLLLTSDPIDNLSPEQWSEFEEIFDKNPIQITGVTEIGPDQYTIDLVKQKTKYRAWVNLGNKKASFLHRAGNFELEPYESLLVKR